MGAPLKASAGEPAVISVKRHAANQPLYRHMSGEKRFFLDDTDRPPQDVYYSITVDGKRVDTALMLASAATKVAALALRFSLYGGRVVTLGPGVLRQLLSAEVCHGSR